MALVTSSLVLAIASAAGASPSAPTPAQVCATLTDADLAKVLKGPPKAEPSDGLNGSRCMWVGAMGGNLQIEVETDELLKAKKTGQTVKQRFGYMEDEIAKKRAVAVKGIGEKAVWASGILWVLKGDMLISVGKMGVKQSDVAAQDLTKSIAAKVLAKL